MSGNCEAKQEGKPLWCSTPGTPCNCASGPNNYQENCKPTWSKLKYPQKFTVKDEITKKTLEVIAIEKSYEAHHIACVAQVNDIVVGMKDQYGYADILDKTQWCINAITNMIALPMWGHTIMWYCKQMLANVKYNKSNGKVLNLDALRPIDTGNLEEPPFSNLPQHNYGHGGQEIETSYNMEIRDSLEKLVQSLQKDKKKHENERIASIASKLNKLSDEYRKELKEVRGKREHGGTHKAWLAGCADKDDTSKWYMPFSMARKPREISFPVSNFNAGLGAKIKDVAENLFRLLQNS
jgi:hypothetical protein